jgi:hypothetical protein
LVVLQGARKPHYGMNIRAFTGLSHQAEGETGK